MLGIVWDPVVLRHASTQDAQGAATMHKPHRQAAPGWQEAVLLLLQHSKACYPIAVAQC